MRPRFNRRSGRSYDPNAENKEASIQKAQITGETAIYKGPLSVDYLFVFPRPKGHYGTGKNSSMLKDSSPVFCCNTKDLDNMEKFYADSFNSIAYEDDRQIVRSSAVKRWAVQGEQPFVEIFISPYEVESI